jgi:hypothetical protein
MDKQRTEAAAVPATPEAQIKIADTGAITISARVAEFWPDEPSLWFAQLEAVLAPQKASDESKYNFLITKLGKQQITQVADIIFTPPTTDKYKTLKRRLLEVYEVSATTKLHQLLGELELGDLKPSQLLRKMKGLATTKLPEDTLKILWMGRLPTSISSVLSVFEEIDLEKLATSADRLAEQLKGPHINQVQQPPSYRQQFIEQVNGIDTQHKPGPPSSMNHTSGNPTRYNSGSHNNIGPHTTQSIDHIVNNALADFTNKIDVVGMHRRQEKKYRFRSKSRNRSNSRRRHDEHSCWYHNTFGARAQKCVEPCKFTEQKN